jgi:hypothetical protein
LLSTNLSEKHSKLPEVVRRKQIAGSPALYSFFVGWVSADDKWSACTKLGEQMCISVAESVMMSKKPENWSPWRGRAQALERALGTTHHRGSGRKMHDSVVQVEFGA